MPSRFKTANDKGNAFTNFQEGVAGVWEGYKPRLRDHALRILAFDGWSESSIGSGAILRHVTHHPHQQSLLLAKPLRPCQPRSSGAAGGCFEPKIPAGAGTTPVWSLSRQGERGRYVRPHGRTDRRDPRSSVIIINYRDAARARPAPYRANAKASQDQCWRSIPVVFALQAKVQKVQSLRGRNIKGNQ
jgi:hypothetical protein